MKKVYYKTNIQYIIICVLIGALWVVEILKYINDEIKMPMVLICFIYFGALFINVMETIANRKRMEEIIKNSKIKKAKVKKLIKVWYNYNWGKGGGALLSYYQIVAVEDSDSNDHTYYSEPIYKKYKSRIPEYVDVYQYMGNNCMVWDYSKKYKIRHDVEEGRTYKPKISRSIMCGLAVYCSMVFMLFMIFVFIMP